MKRKSGKIKEKYGFKRERAMKYCTVYTKTYYAKNYDSRKAVVGGACKFANG